MIDRDLSTCSSEDSRQIAQCPRGRYGTGLHIKGVEVGVEEDLGGNLKDLKRGVQPEICYQGNGPPPCA